MAADITTLVLETRSVGISQSAQHLRDFTAAAEKAEAANTKLGNSAKSSGESQKASAAATEALMAKLQRQVDLLGANTSQTNSYTAAMKGLDKLHQQMAGMLGAEADAYKRLGADQSAAYKQKETMQMRDIEMQKIASQQYSQAHAEALRMNAARLSAEKQYAAAQAEAIRMNNAMAASQRAAQASGNILNELGQRQIAYKKLSEAQAEAIRMNTAFDASIRRQQETMQRRDLELHTQSTRAYAQAQAEAIRMNTARDASLRGDAVRRSAADVRAHSEAMREAHAAARGLSGSLGMLWMTYGNIAGMAVGVAIGASLKGVLSVGKDVEHTLETLRVKGGETVESANKMREAIYSIGQGIYGPQEVVKALEVLVLAGLNATQAMAALRPALNLATAGGTDIKTAAEGLVTIGTAVGASAEHYTMLADGITTAANISLASVESITNTVKRASVVNKLYGASFEDILIQASALANLGIKDTAAGTAITNFYSDMQGKSDKAKKALAELGVQFSDANGKAKPLVEMMKDFNTALNDKTLDRQKTLIMDIFGERSKRDVVAITSMIRTASTEAGEYGSKLEEIAGKISNMAGASTLAAVQIALTTENQIKSMSNTLKVTLAKTFTELEPQVNVFTAKMKEAFNSPQFAAALVSISSAVASLAVGFVNNIGPLTTFVAGIVALKVATSGMALATMLTGPLMATATAFGSTAVAASGATIATGAFGTAIRLLPFVGLAASIATVIGALIMYKFHMEGAKNAAIETAEAYRSNYLDALKDEADQIKRTTDNLARGMPLMEAQTKSIKEQALAKAQLNNENAIAAAQSDLDSAKKGFNDAYGLDYLKFAEKNGKLPPVILQLTAELNKQKAAADNFTIQSHLRATAIVAGSEIIRQAYLKEQKAAEEAAKATAGTNGGKPPVDKSAEQAAYNTELKRIQGEIDQVARTLSRNKEALQSYVKQGQIGEILMIKQIEAAEISSAQTTIDLLKVKLAAAKTLEDKGAVQQQIANAEVAQIDAVAAATSRSANQQAEYYSKLADANMKTKAKEFESNGQYVEAYKALNDAKYNYEKALLESNLENTQDAANKELIIARQVALEKERISGIEYASVKQAYSAFEVLRGAASNIFKGLVADNQGLGIAGIFTAAMEASQKFQADLPALQEKLLALKALAEATGASDFAKKDYNKALSEMQTLANNQKTMWAEVGESITKSLGDAFGEAGKSAGKLLMTTVLFSNTQKKLDSEKADAVRKIGTSEMSFTQKVTALKQVDADFDRKDTLSRLSAFGGMAEAAQGFFDKQSTGYKVMGTISKAFHLAEMAMQMATVGPKLIAGAATMFGQSGWGGFAGVAAMGAVMAGLGYAMSGGGGGEMSSKERQEKAGTGTILGDETAKSESIANSLEHLEKDSGLGLVHSQLMVNSLHNIEASMTGLSALVVRGKLNTASVQGSLGGAEAQWLKLTSDAIDPLNKLTGKIVGAIFGGKVSVQDYGIKIGESTLGQVNQSGASVAGYTDTKKSGGLFHSDKYSSTASAVDSAVTQQVSLIIQSLGTSVKLAGDALGISGEDFSKNLEAFKIKIEKISFKDLKGDEIQDQFAAIFSALGDDMAAWAVKGLDEFTQLGEGPLETLMRITNEFVQVTDVMSVLGQKFNVFGLDAVRLSEQLINAAGTLEKLTEGTKFLVENIFTPAERLAPIAASVTAAMDKLGFASVKTIEQFDALIHAQDLNTKAGQEMYVELMNIAPAFKTVADGAKELRDSLNDIAGSALDNLSRSIDREKDTAKAAYDAQIAIIKAQRTSAEAVYKDNKTVLDATIKTSTDASTALKALSSSLKSTLDSMFLVTEQAMRRESAQLLISKALDLARSTGILPKVEDLADALKTVSQPAENLFATFTDYARDVGVTKGKITDLKDLSDKALDTSDNALLIAKDQLAMLEDQYKASQLASEAQEKQAQALYDGTVSRLDAILENAKTQLEVANGTYQAVLSLSDALKSFAASLPKLTAASVATGAVGSSPATSSGITGLYKDILDRTPDAGGQAYWEGMASKGATPTQIADSLYKSAEYQVKGLYENILGRAPDAGGMTYWTDKISEGETIADISKQFYSSAEYVNGSHADGLERVPFDNYKANLHAGERVLTAKAAKDSDTTAEEIRQLRTDLNAALLSIAQNTGKTTKLLTKFDGDGMPETRVVTA